MITDKRLQKLAYNLVNFSTRVKEGEKVWINAKSCDYQFVNHIVEEVYKAKGIPFVVIEDEKITREFLMGLTEETIKIHAKIDADKMSQMDCFIGVRGTNNDNEFADVPQDKMELYNREYFYPVHHQIRVGKTKWVVLRYPTSAMAQMSGMSTEKFEDFYFDVCNLDYSKMDNAMDNLQALMNKTDKVRLVAKDTDITFSIKGIPAIKCAGNMNIPDGEIYTAPVKDSINGTIKYNVPSQEGGIKYEDIKLTFKDGKIIDATSNHTEEINKVFDTDEGSRYVGEFAIGVNPYITKPMGDILFDEKISGSIHFTPGCCYDDAFNGNQSAIHWDLVLIQTEEYGGGEIYFDDVLIRKDGLFVLDELKCLNPENLWYSNVSAEISRFLRCLVS